MASSSKKNSYIDFDLHFENFINATVLVINLLDEERFPSSIKKFDCNIFNENECHHKEIHSNLNELCDFCQFVLLLRKKFSDVRVNKDKECISFKYRTKYSSDILEWTEFQVRRAPLILLGYALCKDQSDLMYSVKNFEHFKATYKKTLFTSKLIINSQIKPDDKNEIITESETSLPVSSVHPLEQEFNSTFNEQNFEKVSLNRSISYDTESLYSFDQGRQSTISFEESITTNNLDINMDSSISLTGLINEENKMSAKILVQNKERRIDIENIMPELKAKLKTLEMEKNVSHLKNETNWSESSDLAKLEAIIVESAIFVSKKIFDLVKSINPNDDRQLNQYSEFLKSPMESKGKSAGSTLTESSNLSIKVINKKTVAARMHKYKADLHMLLKMYELAIYHYYQGYQLSKKEEDFLWTNSSIEGLCIASYFYSQTNSKETKSGSFNTILF